MIKSKDQKDSIYNHIVFFIFLYIKEKSQNKKEKVRGKENERAKIERINACNSSIPSR